MTNNYARQQQLATGNALQARDLRIGDTVMMRAAGETDRTPQTIVSVWRNGNNVVMQLESGRTHHASPSMKIELVRD